MSTTIRTIFAGAALSLAILSGTQVYAQDCPTEPVFVGKSGPNANVRQSARRVERGDFRNAAVFANNALNSGTSPRNKNAASINLCAALAAQSDEGAAAACEDAVSRNEGAWEAYTNRGAFFWMTGNRPAASADFARAAELQTDEEAVTSNTALASCGG